MPIMETRILNLNSILLVEDDPRDVELTLAALEASHLANRVAVAENGEEALDYLYCRGKFKLRTGGNPIVVLLDNKMPKVSGLEVLQAIKADDHLKSIPVVALTSSRETPDLVDFYKHGVNAYVVKPVNFPDFMKVVQELGSFGPWSMSRPLDQRRRSPNRPLGGPRKEGGLPMKSPLNILHLEDDLNDAALVSATLEAGGIACATTRVQNRDEFVAALERGGFDLILSAFSLPAFDGLAAMQIAKDRWPALPVILVSGTLGEELAVESLKSGATDYVLKERLTRLAPAVRRAMHEVEAQAEHHRLAAQLIDAQKWRCSAISPAASPTTSIIFSE